MTDGGQSDSRWRASRLAPGTGPTAATGRRGLPLRAVDVQLYHVCDWATEGLIYLMVLFSPWAFGTTQTWSTWVMNAGGYALGLLLAVKLFIRWFKGYAPPRWGAERSPRAARWLVHTLAVLTLAILAYGLISAVNASATFVRHELRFEYHDHVAWLPASLDGPRTWFAFWTTLGLACSFWAVRDWLLGKSREEERATSSAGVGRRFPARLRRLLWVLCLNGGLLGLEGIAQRLEGSGRLLWLVKPRVNPEAEAQFGPWAYRANASQYFNLLWPVCLGFWWRLHRHFGGRRSRHHLLLCCGVIMAACPIISTSRGGALVAVGLAGTAALILLGGWVWTVGRPADSDEGGRGIFRWVTLFFVGALGLGYMLGWQSLRPRLSQIHEGFEQREQMFDVARPMAADYPLFGTGPGTFESVFQLYRVSPETYWPAQLHNDWLETRITYGWVGSGLIGLALVVALARWFLPGGIRVGPRFVMMIWLGLAGCLVHARFDFPFQIHSIVFLFLLLCAVLFSLSRRR